MPFSETLSLESKQACLYGAWRCKTIPRWQGGSGAFVAYNGFYRVLRRVCADYTCSNFRRQNIFYNTSNFVFYLVFYLLESRDDVLVCYSKRKSFKIWEIGCLFVNIMLPGIHTFIRSSINKNRYVEFHTYYLNQNIL